MSEDNNNGLDGDSADQGKNVQEQHAVKSKESEDEEWEEEDEFKNDDDEFRDDWDDESMVAEPHSAGEDKSSDEEEGADTENVNFNEMVLDEEARKAVTSKRGSKSNEYSDRLTEGFKLLMGEANLCVAKGDRKTAKNICLEIIRNIPDSPAPYETLSVIFEEENDLYKSLQYGLVSAHLWPKDPHKWHGLAEKCTELQDKENEKICMGKALRYSHLTRDKGFIEEILSYFVKPDTLKDELSEEVALKLAIGYRKLIKISSSDDTEELTALLQSFEARCSGNYRKEEFWAKTYQFFIGLYPEKGSPEKIRKICELYLSGEHYGRLAPLLSDARYIEGETVPTMPGPSSQPASQTEPVMETAEETLPSMRTSDDSEKQPSMEATHETEAQPDLETGPSMDIQPSMETQPGLETSLDLADVSKDIHDKVQERLSDMEGGNNEAATISFDTRFSVISDLFSPYIRAALVAALIYTDHDSNNIESLQRPLLKELQPEQACKEFLLVADAYFATNVIDTALPIYDVLSKTCNVEHAHTLIRLGLCLERTGKWKEAVKCYERVLGFDEENTAAKLRLFTLQQSFIADHEDEFSVNIHAGLDSVKELSARPDVVKLSFHRCYELISSGSYTAVMEEGYNVLKTALFESIEQQKTKSLKATSAEFLRGNNTSASAFHTLAHIVKEKIGYNKGACEEYRDMLTREEWYDWYIGILSCCMASDRLNDGFILSLSALASRLIDLPPAMKDIQIHSIYLAGVLNYCEYISENIGLIIHSNPDTPGIWNIFYSIRHRLPQYRLHRLGIRWIHKNKGAFNGLFLGMQNSLYSRHYKAAIAFFRQMLGQRPRDAKIYFYLSVFYMQYAATKGLEFSSRRHEMSIQAIACILMYQQLRGACQETFYNIGRCYHHLGLFTLALQYYKRALACPAALPKEVQAVVTRMRKSCAKQQPEQDAAEIDLYDVDLKREVVHNLTLIYRTCGADHLARQLMYTHATIR